MKNTNNIQKIKFILLVAIIGLGIHFASAFPAPVNPPSNDVTGIADITDQYQAKGYNFINTTPLTKFDIDDSSDINETLSTNALAVFVDTIVGNDTYVNGLTGPNYVCSDHTGKLVICTGGGGGGGGPMCGNGIVEGSEDCDLGAGNGPWPITCSTSCTLNAGGGGGGPVGNVYFSGNFRWGKLNYYGPATHPAIIAYVDLYGSQSPSVPSGPAHTPQTKFYIPANSTQSYDITGISNPANYMNDPCNGIGCEIEGTGGFSYGAVGSVSPANVTGTQLPAAPAHVCRFDPPEYPGPYFTTYPVNQSCSSYAPGSTQYQ